MDTEGQPPQKTWPLDVRR